MMSTENTRLNIRQWFQSQMDDEELAAAVMDAMPPIDYKNLATKDDLRLTRVELRSEMAEVRGDLAEVRGELAVFKGEMATEFAAVRSEMTSNLRLIFASQAASTFILLGVALA